MFCLLAIIISKSQNLRIWLATHGGEKTRVSSLGGLRFLREVLRSLLEDGVLEPTVFELRCCFTVESSAQVPDLWARYWVGPCLRKWCHWTGPPLVVCCLNVLLAKRTLQFHHQTGSGNRNFGKLQENRAVDYDKGEVLS